MAGPTTTATLAESIPTEFIAEVRLKEQEGSIMRPLVQGVNLPEHQGGTYQMNELSRATISALGEGIDMPSAQAIVDSSLQIVPIEYGGKVELTDLARDQVTSQANMPRLIGEILGNGIITKEDVDLLTQLDSFSVALGSAGTALTIGHIMAAGAAVRSGGQAAAAIGAGTPEPAPDPINGVFSDNQLHTVIKNLAIGRQILTTSGASQEGPQPGEAASRALVEARVDKIGRVNVYADNNLGKDAADDAKGGVWAQKTIIHVRFRGGPKFEPDRDPSGRITEYNVVLVKGIGEWKDAWGSHGPSKISSDQWGTPEMATLSKQAQAVQLHRLSEETCGGEMRQSGLRRNEGAEVGRNDQPSPAGEVTSSARDVIRCGKSHIVDSSRDQGASELQYGRPMALARLHEQRGFRPESAVSALLGPEWVSLEQFSDGYAVADGLDLPGVCRVAPLIGAIL